MDALGGLVDRGLMAPDWAEALAPVDERIAAMGRFLRAELAGARAYLPAGDDVFKAFRRPLADVRVLIVGQDPFPTPGTPAGLWVAVAPDVRPLRGSLRNVYQELSTDLGIPPAPHGDLTAWADRGVMLLNPGHTRPRASHAPAPARAPRPAAPPPARGWEEVTDTAIAALVRRGGPTAAILWGRDAQSLRPALGSIPWVESAHPSPLSAARGFFGSRPFSRVNHLLADQGGEAVDWSLPG